jgi:hypothetical protein
VAIDQQHLILPSSLFTSLGIEIFDPLDDNFSISVSFFLVTKATKG